MSFPPPQTGTRLLARLLHSCQDVVLQAQGVFLNMMSLLRRITGLGPPIWLGTSNMCQARYLWWPLLLYLYGAAAAATDQSGFSWQSCRSISDDQQRLACYDRWAERLAQQPEKTENQRHATLFGRRARPTQDTLHAHLGKDLVALDGHTLLPLDNGQVWQQIDGAEVVFRARHSAVTIRRGLFNSYLMHIQGLNRAIRVRRVQ